MKFEDKQLSRIILFSPDLNLNCTLGDFLWPWWVAPGKLQCIWGVKLSSSKLDKKLWKDFGCKSFTYISSSSCSLQQFGNWGGGGEGEGQETWHLYGCIWYPSSSWLNFTGMEGTQVAPWSVPSWIRIYILSRSLEHVKNPWNGKMWLMMKRVALYSIEWTSSEFEVYNFDPLTSNKPLQYK